MSGSSPAQMQREGVAGMSGRVTGVFFIAVVPHQDSLADQRSVSGHCGTFLNGPGQSLTLQPQTFMTGLVFGESPRWHDERLWLADWLQDGRLVLVSARGV